MNSFPQMEDCDPAHASPRGTIAALIDEVQAEHRATFTERPKRTPVSFRYGVRRSRSNIKYAGCEYVQKSGTSIRKLTATEIAGFQLHVDRCIEQLEAQPV